MTHILKHLELINYSKLGQVRILVLLSWIATEITDFNTFIRTFAVKQISY